jgi:tRNA pseudouridine13 synthase
MTPLGDPLPVRRMLLAPALGGAIKLRPEDFIVDEIARYEPSGSGEHLFLRIQKTGVAHADLVSLLQRHYGVHEAAIGFAGMKDKVAVTQQNVSIHLPGRADPGPLEHPRIALLWSDRHDHKIRRGHLVGNRFAIRIRKVDPLKAPAIFRRLRELEQSGIPDYYGMQRFGYRRNNHRLGFHLLRGDWEGLLAELLGARGSMFPAHQRARRELFDAGRLAESLAQWAPGDRAERAAMAALAAGASSERAVHAIGQTALVFWISALQSHVFNRTLDRRIDEGLIDRLLEGDVAWKHSSRRVFLVGESDLADPALARRLAEFELSPSGPLPGPGMVAPRSRPAEIEREVLATEGLDEASFTEIPWGGEGTRRPLRVQVSNIDCDSGFDEHGPFVRVVFDLPRGAYATVVVRELVGDLDAPQEDAESA